MKMRDIISLLEKAVVLDEVRAVDELSPKDEDEQREYMLHLYRKSTPIKISSFGIFDVEMVSSDGDSIYVFAVDAWGNPSGYIWLRSYSDNTHIVNMVYVVPEKRTEGIAYQLYKVMMRRGMRIQSDTDQTPGGKAIWNKMLSDPEVTVAAKERSGRLVPIKNTDARYGDFKTMAFVAWMKSAVAESWLSPIKITAYHSSPVENISTFRAFTHFGTEAAARDRLGNRKGVMYKVEISFRKLFRVIDNWAAGPTTLLAWIKRNKPSDIDIRIAEKHGAVAALLKAGYDGLVYKNWFEDIGQDSWVTLRPGQAKIKEVIDLDPFRGDPVGRATYNAVTESLDSWGLKNIRVNPGRETIRHWIRTIMDRRPKWEIAREEDDNRLEYEDMAVRGTVDVNGNVYVVDAYLATHATLHDSVESACDFYISSDYVIHADCDANWITPEQKDAMLKWGERWQMPVVK